MSGGSTQSVHLVKPGLRVQVPASSANIGPGFDVLGMALSLYAHLEVISDSSPRDKDGQPHDAVSKMENSHPAVVAFRAAGGQGELGIKCSIPSGRGLGFSGAVRVGGVSLGLASSAQVEAHDLPAFIADHHQAILDLSCELEGHGDNVAASLYGGVTAVVPNAQGRLDAIGIPLSPLLSSRSAIAVWVPSFKTSTSQSRQTLSPTVDRADAVFNIAHAIRLTVALTGLDGTNPMLSRLGPAGLRSTLADRLHQDRRLESAPLSKKALETMVTAGAMTAWLSGSGPTVAALCDLEQVSAVEAALQSDEELHGRGRVLRLGIDSGGLQAAR